MLVGATPGPGGEFAAGAAYRLQPPLHELVSTVMAPTGALSGADGQIRPFGVQGSSTPTIGRCRRRRCS